MTTAAHTGPNPYGLIRAAEAVTNWPALAMTGLAGLAFFLCLALSAWITKNSVTLGFLCGLATMAVGMVGYSSVGIVLMRRAQNVSIGIADALVQALLTVHRLLGVALLLFLVFLGVALGALLVLFVCKLPGLGNLLYAIAFPILTIVLGTISAGMFYVALPLAAPAVWAGNTVWETTARILVIVRQRLLPVITHLVVLSLLVLFLSAVVSFVLYSGYAATTGLSAAVGIHTTGGMMGMLQGAMMGGASGYQDFDGAMSYAGAHAFASGLILTIGMIIPFLTFINGTCLIYLQTIEGLQFDAAEEQLRSHVDEAKRRAQEAKERAGSKLQEAKAAVQRPTPPSPSPQAQAPQQDARTCCHCGASLAPDDVFCGECGTKNPV